MNKVLSKVSEEKARKGIYLTKINAVRFDCHSGEPRVVELEVFIKKGEQGAIIDFGKNGVTGYESYYLDDVKEEMSIGIFINAGTEKRWDQLYISGIIWKNLIKLAELRVEKLSEAS